MHASFSSRSFLGLSAACALLLSSGCDAPATLQPDDDPAFARSGQAAVAQSEMLRAVRQATSRFNSTTQAIRAGYQPDDHCVAVPGLGGMGYHWANPFLVDETFDPLRPEVMLYARGPGGNLRLVAVEYIVLNVGQEWPDFDGHPFDEMGTPVPAPHWSLHVWLYEENPLGIFRPFNPNVSCP